MKQGSQGKIAALSVGLLILNGASSAAANQKAAASSAPKASKEACEMYKPIAQVEVKEGQADRDYVDSQYAFYQSVAQGIYDKLQATIKTLNQRHKDFAAAKEGLLNEKELGAIRTSVDPELKALFFPNGYLFCPADTKAATFRDAISDEERVICDPQPAWWKAHDFPAFAVETKNAGFWLNRENQPSIQFTYSERDKNNEVYEFKDNAKKATIHRIARMGQERTISGSFNELTVDKIFSDIWPYEGAPARSPTPDQVLKQMLAEKGCLIYEPDYKPNTATRSKTLDERRSGSTSGAAHSKSDTGE